MASNSVALIAHALNAPRPYDDLHWVSNNPPYRTTQDYAVTEYLYRIKVCALHLGGGVALSQTNGAEGGMIAGDGLRSSVLSLTAQLFHLGVALSPVVSSKAVAAALTAHFLHCNYDDEWLTFPVELCDLPLDVECCFHLYRDGEKVTSCSLSLFTIEGELRTGMVQLALHPPLTAVEEEVRSGDEAPAETARQQQLFADFRRGLMPTIPWLDALSERRMEELQQKMPYAPKASGRLTLFLPTTRTAVFFQPPNPSAVSDAPPHQQVPDNRAFSRIPYRDAYNFRKEHNLSEAKAAITSKALYLVSDATVPPGLRDRQRLSQLLTQPPIQIDGSLRVEETRLLWQYRNFITRDGRFFLPFMRTVDWTNTHSAERRTACALLTRWVKPPFVDVVACLCFYFEKVVPIRQYAIHLLNRCTNERLCQIAFFLVQAIRYDSSEGELASFLLTRSLGHWELCSTLYTYLSVESAVERQRGETAAPEQRSTPANSVYDPLLRRLIDRLSETHPNFADRLKKQRQLHRFLRQLSKQLQEANADRIVKMTLGNRLLQKQACGLRELFAVADPVHTTATAVSSSASRAIEAEGPVTVSPSGEASYPLLDNHGVVTLPTHPMVPITGIVPNSVYMYKSAKMPISIAFKALLPFFDAAPASSGGQPPRYILPFQRSGSASAVTSSSASSHYHSGASPLLIFRPLAMMGQHRGGPTTYGNNSGGSLPPRGSVRQDAAGEDTVRYSGVEVELAMMFKYNDDVRQDQLIAQLIQLIDDLLQHDGLQLYLTPYRVVATGPNEGLVEVVPRVTTFQSVQREVLRHLRIHNPTSERLKDAMDRYTRSFAGYCVITFVLGIGDRHLENILLAQDGRLLHIDFGYIFGNDPKPFPPSMKISREMVEVLGGPQSSGYMEFKSYCCSAYNIIRKHAALLLHLLLLMAHAEGMPQVTGESGDPRVHLLKVQQKLRLDLSDAQATQYLQNVIADSVGSIFTNLWDALHAAAQATRT